MMNHVIIHSNTSVSNTIFDSANTIYDIRCELDFIDTSTNSISKVEIGDNCVLRFIGGCIKNAKIIANDCRIVSPLVKIFYNCTFGGNFLIGTVFQIEWFVANYETSLKADTQNDAYAEIQQAFNSGIRKVHFNNDRYYPVSRTIEINGNLDITGRKSHLDATSNWFHREPCIYGRAYSGNDPNYTPTGTILKFNYQAINNDINGTNLPSKPRLSIEGLNICQSALLYNNDSIDTPLVEINNVSTMTLLGLYLDLNIIVANYLATDTSPSIVEDNYKYTGIKIYTNNKPITYIEISGSASLLYKAYEIKGEANSNLGSSPWITDIKIRADTACVYGGDFSAVYTVHPVINYGSHQLRAYFNSYDNGEAYFKADSFNNYGYIWDAGLQDSNNKWYCQYAVKPHTPSCGFLMDRSQEQYSGASVVHPVDVFYPNLLVDGTIKYSGIDISTNTVILAYNKTNGTKENAVATTLAFRRYKFPKYLCRWDNTHYNLSHHSDIGFCYNQNDNNNYIYKETIEIVKSNFLSIQDMAPIYIGPSRPRETFSITIQYFATSTDSNPTKTINIDNSNYDTYLYGDYIRVTDLFLRKKDSFYLTAKTIITYNQDITTDTELIPRPMFFIPNYHATGIVRSGDDTAMVNMSQFDAGEVFYHQTHGQLWWNGTKWVERDGASAGVRRSGTFAQRPSGSDVYVGFRYFCMSGARINQTHVPNVELFYTGSGWVDALGRTATAN